MQGNGLTPWKIDRVHANKLNLDFIDLPIGNKAIKNKRVLEIKQKANKSIEKYKARLMTKGYTHREGVKYKETFFHL